MFVTLGEVSITVGIVALIAANVVNQRQVLLLITIVYLMGSVLVSLRCRERWWVLWLILCAWLPATHLWVYFSSSRLIARNDKTSILVPIFMTGHPLEVNEVVVIHVLQVVSIAAAGTYIGLRIARKLSCASVERSIVTRREWDSVSFSVFAVLAVMLAWLGSPADSVFTSSYATTSVRSSELGFSSAWLIAAAIVVFLTLDAFTERGWPRPYKSLVLFVVVVVVLGWFGLAHGDRDYILFALGVTAVIVMRSRAMDSRIRLPNPRRSITGISLLFAGTAVGAYLIGRLRSSVFVAESPADVVGLVFSEAIVLREYPWLITYGPWSHVLHTLFVGVESVNLREEALKFGVDYANLLMSIPPEFFFSAFGLTRPLSNTAGPAVEYWAGHGGLHYLVAPYVNFGTVGVFLYSALLVAGWLLFVGWTMRRFSLARGLALSMAFGITPLWLWYGEKYLLNAAIITFLVIGIDRTYQYFLRIRRTDLAVKNADL